MYERDSMTNDYCLVELKSKMIQRNRLWFLEISEEANLFTRLRDFVLMFHPLAFLVFLRILKSADSGPIYSLVFSNRRLNRMKFASANWLDGSWQNISKSVKVVTKKLWTNFRLKTTAKLSRIFVSQRFIELIVYYTNGVLSKINSDVAAPHEIGWNAKCCRNNCNGYEMMPSTKRSDERSSFLSPSPDLSRIRQIRSKYRTEHYLFSCSTDMRNMLHFSNIKMFVYLQVSPEQTI